MTVSHSWLILRLEAPLVAFGGVTVDQIGVIRDFPAASMLTGLIANALGWDRSQRAAHQALQDRLVFSVRRDRESASGILTDSQNAKLEKDKGWTTWGEPEERAGATYDSPHRRRRDYHPDACVTVAMRLRTLDRNLATNSDLELNLDRIAAALDYPARPIFLGRKPCLPTAPVHLSQISAKSAYDALTLVSPVGQPGQPLRALWPLGEGPESGANVDRVVELPDLRNWRTGLHGGSRTVVEGRVIPVETSQ